MRTTIYQVGNAVTKTKLELKIEELEEEIKELKYANERMQEEIDRMWNDIGDLIRSRE